MSRPKASEKRWRAIRVVSFGNTDVNTIALDGKGGIAGGLTRMRQSYRRLDLSRVREEFASDRPAWRFAGANDDLPTTAKPDAAWESYSKPEFDDVVEPVAAHGIQNREELWADDIWL
jgi:hypothetical protein